MALYELGKNHMVTIKPTTFECENIKEREDLQRLLRERIEIIVPDGMVLAEEFSNWEESNRRIDLLVLDRDANLVVVELKRTTDGGHMELQALRYAAMISTMTFEQAVEAHQQFLKAIGKKEEDAATNILSFLEWNEVKEDEFAQEIKIVLASANFSKELTTAVLWLIDRDIDFRCVRMVPYKYDEQIILDVQQIIPLSEATEYTVKMKIKSAKERESRKIQDDRDDKYFQFWSQIIPKAKNELPLFQNTQPVKWDWLPDSSNSLNYAFIPRSRVKSRVELYIDHPNNKQLNIAIFNDIALHRSEIENAFGAALNWNRCENKNPCRISADIESGNFNDESTWEALQDDLLKTMKRFEEALRPFVEYYREGGKPESVSD